MQAAAPVLLLIFLAGTALGQEGAPVADEGAPVADDARAMETSAGPASIPEMLEDETFHYDSVGKRDPFKSLMSLGPKPGPPPEELPPIQRIDLVAVKITGVVIDKEAGSRAMIDAGGRSFVVKEGILIGKNEGEVIEVSLEGIRIVEKFVDFMGRETLKEVFIKARPSTTGK